MNRKEYSFPLSGLPAETILEEMRSFKTGDVNWQGGKTFSLVYQAGEAVHTLAKQAYQLYFSENGLNPTAFSSLRNMETEVIAMSADLLGGDSTVVGNMTSGGTESILMAMKTARDWGRNVKGVSGIPEVILPVTGHPAFEKAAEYFNLKIVHTPVDSEFQAQGDAARNAITQNTVMLVASAPSYPHGVIDPIEEIAGIAKEHEILCHVDACVGGFLLPFVRFLGYPVPDFDFRVPGVTSISADLHKYGYASKGASLVLYRDKSVRRHQLFVYTDWPGGIYASATMAGTRPGGAIAAAWAVMNYLGFQGYLDIAAGVMNATEQLKAGIQMLPGVYILGEPVMSVMAIGSDEYPIFEIGDEMTLRGWHLDRQQFPSCLHLTVHYGHLEVVHEFLKDLAESIEVVRKGSRQQTANQVLVRVANAAVRWLPSGLVSKILPAVSPLLVGGKGNLPERSAAMYGMMGTLPNRGDLKELVLDLVEGFTERNI